MPAMPRISPSLSSRAPVMVTALMEKPASLGGVVGERAVGRDEVGIGAALHTAP